jgi:hypothetical protein
MDFYESVPMLRRYRRTWVEQEGVDLYYYQTNRSTPNLSPTDEYLGYIVDGLETHPDVNPEYRAQIAALATAQPGGLVNSYLSEQAPNRIPLIGVCIDGYQRVTLKIFLDIIARVSLTEWLIRRDIDTTQ